MTCVEEGREGPVVLASGGPCQGGRRAERARISLSADCPSGQDPPEADEKDASGGPCQGGRRAERARISLSADCPSGQDPPEADEKDASGGPCQGGRRAERANLSLCKLPVRPGPAGGRSAMDPTGPPEQRSSSYSSKMFINSFESGEDACSTSKSAETSFALVCVNI